MDKSKKVIVAIIVLSLALVALILFWVTQNRGLISVQNAIKKTKSSHSTITIKDGDKTISSYDVDMLFPASYKGTLKSISKDKETITDFMVVNYISYRKTQGEDKYQKETLNPYSPYLLQNPVEILNQLTKDPKWEKVTLGDTSALYYKGEIITSLDEPGVQKKYPVEVWLDAQTQYLLKIVITADLPDQKTTLTKTIEFSDYNKKVDISAPADSEITK